MNSSGSEAFKAPAWVWRGKSEGIRRAVADAIVDLAPVRPPQRRGRGEVMPEVRDDSPLVLVACSGGADSLAVAIAAAHVGPRLGLRVGAVIVDHRLQKGSDAVAREAAGKCSALGLAPVIVRAVDVGEAKPGAAGRREPGGGPEADARLARYEALDLEAARLGAAAIMLGHTLDDQAETVLLGLGRGAGARSLAGMAARRGRYRRPVLALRRADTEATCREAGLEFWEDPTNFVTGLVSNSGTAPGATVGAGPAPDREAALGVSEGSPPVARTPLRSRVRGELMPVLRQVLGPDVDEALARSAERLREDADFLDGLADDVLEHASRDVASAPAPGNAVESRAQDSTRGGFAVATLAQAPRPVLRRALRKLMIDAGSPAADVSFRHVLAVEGLISSWHGQGPISLPGGLEVARRCGTLVTSQRYEGFLKESRFVDADDMGKDLENVLLSQNQIAARIAELAAQIDKDYAGKDVLLVGVLKGAVMVMADLARAMHVPLEMDWMAVSSYGSGTKSSGVVRIIKDLDNDLTGRHVLIVEDIVDSGLTLSWLVANLRSRGPETVEVCALLRKPEAAKVDVDARYVGFDIPTEFVVGYGLDYAERYRNLPFVGTLAAHVYEN